MRRTDLVTGCVRFAIGAAASIAAAALLTACATSQSGTGVAAPLAKSSSSAAAHVAPNPMPARPAAASTHPAAAVHVAVNHCAGNSQAQLVKVSLSAQHMWLCHEATTVLDTAITSGASALPYDSTPTGNFHIQGRDRNSVLTLNTGQQYNVKYWIPFSAPLFGFHDSSWQDFPYGSPKYRTEGSHGCVHMPLTAIAFLYRWAHVGTPVQIRA
jgi:hypothetical protein